MNKIWLTIRNIFDSFWTGVQRISETSTVFYGTEISQSNLSNEKNLVVIGDYTHQVYRDYDKPL